MQKILFVATIVGMLVSLTGAAQQSQREDKERQEYISPQWLVADQDAEKLYVAAAISPRLLVVDLAEGKVAGEIALPYAATGLALSLQTSRLYITGGRADGAVYAVGTAAGQVELIARAGHTPLSPVLSKDNRWLYVCNRYDNCVSVIDLSSRSLAKTIQVPREPIAAALTLDGSTLIVANHLPAQASDVDDVAATVSIIDTKAGQVVASIRLPNGSTGLQGLCLSCDGHYAYVTHILGRHHLPTTQIERGWINTNALSIIDLDRKQWLNTVLLDDVDRGAANPWGVACTEDNKYLVVALSGTHELCIINRGRLHSRLAQAAAGEKVSSVTSSTDEVRDDLSFLVGAKRRVPLPGSGPRALAVVGSRVFASEYFTDSLAVLDLDKGEYAKAESTPLQKPLHMSDTRRGEMLFHDAALCFQQWQSCASCHPGSGRVDALNWDLVNDGIGNPKNTKSLLLAHATPPAMSLGIREDAHVAVRAGIRYIQFAVRPEEDAVAIDAYLQSLKPIPSPHLIDGRMSSAARRGQKAFSQAGCAHCHSGPLYTDLGRYDVGTGSGLDEAQALDTPTLIEVWRTAPYLHDGRAATISDVLTKYNPDNKHGRTSNLTSGQLQDLAEFVLTR
ncbi:MAG: c-type cytochrome [Phycisphaerales bacterium]|nr:MAG: c-type cytochrome [Phycisphaerales bacterium]